jgi:hypothetical protein
LIALRDGEDALLAYQQAQLLAVASQKEFQAAQEAAVGQSPEVVQAIRDQAAALRERAALLADQKAAREFLDAQRKLADDLSRLFDTAGSALLDFVSGTKSAKDAFKDFAKSVERDLASMAIAVLKNQLFNGGKGGNGIFDLFGKIDFASLFAGGGSSGGGLNLSSYGPAFGAGTSYAPGGLALVGERGPEIVELPAGARVTPSPQWQGGGSTVIVNQYIPRGANTQAHRQAALDAFDGAAGAARRR